MKSIDHMFVNSIPVQALWSNTDYLLLASVRVKVYHDWSVSFYFISSRFTNMANGSSLSLHTDRTRYSHLVVLVDSDL